MDLTAISSRFPSVVKPEQKVTFRDKLKWTGIILVMFFVLGSINVWGVDMAAVAQFEFLEIVFGSKFGSLLTLGIGPIVTASIILQLLVGSKILNWDTKSEEGKKKFMGTQKVLTIAFCVFEAVAYVAAGAVPPAGGSIALAAVVMAQLALGGYIVMIMDDMCQKWGIGSGVSLFIAAGVAKTIFVRTFSPPIGDTGGGLIASFITSLSSGQPVMGAINLLPLIATLVVFVIVVYVQGIRIEIPMAFSLPFGKFASRRWPLKFLYSSNIPVILTAAVIANVQVLAKMLSAKGITFLGNYDKSGQVVGGLAYYLTSPNSIGLMIVAVLAGVLSLGFAILAAWLWKKHYIKMALIGAIVGGAAGMLVLTSVPQIPAVALSDYARAATYMLAMMVGSVIFSVFWVNTAGMDAASVSEQFKSSFLMIPGFRRDPRIIEQVLERYIPSLAVLGGAFVGFLAGFADLTNALGTGTGILLSVMIVYQFYESIAQQYMEELTPGVRKFLGG
ncbi:MAG: preprotein translocase subunit SecY [Candidatus Aenigmatarchaeota archaeon]